MKSYKIILLLILVVIIILGFVYGRNLVSTNDGAMGSFQQITLMITIMLLLVIFIFIGASLAYAKKNAVNIPIVPQCPDFWEIGGTEASPTCVNVQNLGTCPAATGNKHLTVNFSSGNFTDNCAKYTWANNCNVAWDGLTYGVANPCTTSSVAVPAVAASSVAASSVAASSVAASSVAAKTVV